MTEKFFDKNKSSIEELNTFIETNRKDIAVIFLSCDLRAQLDESDELDFPKYKGIRLVEDAYIPSGFLKVITKSDAISFNTPCLCGIYQDEKHP